MSAVLARAGVTTDPFQQALWSYGDTSNGWTGGDGTYSVPLPGGRTAWLFSDTFLGTVTPEGGREPGAPLIHNSIVVEHAGGFSTVVGSDGPDAPTSLINTTERWSWYWLGDGTVEAGVLRVFLFRFVPVPGPLLFQQISVDLAELSLADLSLQRVVPMPNAFGPGMGGGPVSWGSAILERGDYTYVYGVEDVRVDKRLYVARAPRGNLLAPWQYWNGEAWSDLPLQAAPVMSGAANEMSVSEIGGRFLVVCQENSAGRDIVSFEGTSPVGPFTNRRVLYTTPEPDGTIFTYNAKAHPQRGDAQTLVVSYNTNSFRFADHYENASIYRPRFIRVPL